MAICPETGDNQHRWKIRTYSALGVVSTERTCLACGEVQRRMHGRWTRVRKARTTSEEQR